MVRFGGLKCVYHTLSTPCSLYLEAPFTCCQELRHIYTVLVRLLTTSPSFLTPHSGWITSMDWFHLTSRPNLLNPTPNTWVSAPNATNMIHNEHKLYSFHVLLLCWVFSVNLLSLELTYFCSGLLFAAVVRRRVWDYAFTVTLLHVMITSLGEQKSNNTSILSTHS